MNPLTDAEYILFIDGNISVRNAIWEARHAMVALDKDILGKASLLPFIVAVWKSVTGNIVALKRV